MVLKYYCIVGFAFVLKTANVKVILSVDRGSVRRNSDCVDSVPIIPVAA